MKQIKLTLNKKSIENAIKELEAYKDSLQAKNELFLNRLLEEGITVAQQSVGNFGKHITFSKEVEGGTEAVGFLIAKSTPIKVEWERYGERAEAEVNLLLMSEFGSGSFAEVLFNISGVGQGTFPGQTHAFDEGGWSYKEWTEDGRGKWIHSSGVRPTHPMYNASVAMIQSVIEIAKEVFE